MRKENLTHSAQDQLPFRLATERRSLPERANAAGHRPLCLVSMSSMRWWIEKQLAQPQPLQGQGCRRAKVQGTGRVKLRLATITSPQGLLVAQQHSRLELCET